MQSSLGRFRKRTKYNSHGVHRENFRSSPSCEYNISFFSQVLIVTDFLISYLWFILLTLMKVVPTAMHFGHFLALTILCQSRQHLNRNIQFFADNHMQYYQVSISANFGRYTINNNKITARVLIRCHSNQLCFL